VETNSGVWLDQALRVGACGTWWSAGTASGQPMALLQLEPELIIQPAARDRIATAVAAVRTINPAGVLRTTELLVDARKAWLMVAGVPRSTLADLLTTHATLPVGAAAGLAVDVAAALRELHAAGLSHGALAVDTVVLTAAGSATLSEVGVLAAAHGLPTDIGRDVAAWSALARQLAGATTGREAELLVAAAAIAEAGDLVTAARRLDIAGAEFEDFVSRDALAALIAMLAPAARAPRQRPASDPSTMELPGTGIRVRFGPGVPESAIVRSVQAEAAPRRRRRRPWRLVLALAGTGTLLLAAGAGWLLLLH
jgi:tRNA A-37 threonylcarbamoyl transferase component Bud32